ncbi:MAG: hypothetical protein M3O09_06350 [Acidobacteriota bacterium]|nr:hypothetical protein [Acidobacteriota bacterium]
MANKSAVTLSSPYPLLDPGEYLAICTEATFEWARQWRKHMARLVLNPQNYNGRSYQGKLCKFLSLGRDPERPFAGHYSYFRKLWVELNRDQPNSPEVDMQIFVGALFNITVETVKVDRHGKERKAETWYSIVREIHPAASPTSQPFNTKPSNPLTLVTQTTLTTDQHSNTGNTPLAARDAKTRAVRKSQIQLAETRTSSCQYCGGRGLRGSFFSPGKFVQCDCTSKQS